MSDEALSAVVEEANVFAESPLPKRPNHQLAQEERSRRRLHGRRHQRCTLTENSDVGVSVNNAVDVARESADIILLKNDLTVLAEGVLEGRKTFGNTMKYIMMGVSSNFGNMFSAAGGSLS